MSPDITELRTLWPPEHRVVGIITNDDERLEGAPMPRERERARGAVASCHAVASIVAEDLSHKYPQRQPRVAKDVHIGAPCGVGVELVRKACSLGYSWASKPREKKLISGCGVIGDLFSNPRLPVLIVLVDGELLTSLSDYRVGASH